MSIKASASVTLSSYRDTEAVTRYYKLVSSTSSAPSKPTTNPPSGWDDTEPSYTSGSTNTLYFCDLTEFSDGTWAYSAVSKSSSYEAAKEAYNKAQNAQNTANSANGKIDDLEIGGRNLLKKYIRAGDRCSKIDDSTIKVGTTVGDTFFWLRSHCALTAGETYTISCEASNVPDGCNWSFGVYIQNSTWQLYINKNGKIFATGVLDANVAADTDFLIDDWSERPSTAPNIILTNFKLEKGNKATDWTPAPEDMVDKANIVSCINQTPESITIQANKISLEGLITANGGFKVLEDGSVETINGKFSGAINIYNNNDLIGKWNSDGFVINKYFKAGSETTLDSFFEIDSSENISKVYIGKKRVGYCNEYGVYIDPDNEAYVENDGRFQFFTEYDEDYGRTVNGLTFGNSFWICSKVDTDYPYKFIIDDLQAKLAYINDLYVDGIRIKPTTGTNRYEFPGGLKACWGSVMVTYSNNYVLGKWVSFPFTFTNAPFVTAFITNTNNSYADLFFNLKTNGVSETGFTLFLHSTQGNFDGSSQKQCNWLAVGY